VPFSPPTSVERGPYGQPSPDGAQSGPALGRAGAATTGPDIAAPPPTMAPPCLFPPDTWVHAATSDRHQAGGKPPRAVVRRARDPRSRGKAAAADGTTQATPGCPRRRRRRVGGGGGKWQD
jgi:hypothetical protein